MPRRVPLAGVIAGAAALAVMVPVAVGATVATSREAAAEPLPFHSIEAFRGSRRKADALPRGVDLGSSARVDESRAIGRSSDSRFRVFLVPTKQRGDACLVVVDAKQMSSVCTSFGALLKGDALLQVGRTVVGVVPDRVRRVRVSFESGRPRKARVKANAFVLSSGAGQFAVAGVRVIR